MKIFYTLLIVFGFTTTLQSQNLVMNFNNTGQQLVSNFVGPGIYPANISGLLSPLSNAVFVNNGVPGFTIPSGIILSTGLLYSIENPATTSASTDLGYAGDAQIDALAFPRLSQDATSLEFDFNVPTDSVEFNFMFASEEYNEFVNTGWADLFGFFISGPGYNVNTNIALLPGTTIPIGVNTVNNGNSTGTSTGPCTNCTYYIDNVNTGAATLCYNGFTTVIKIKIAVWPCTDYHLKIAIADVQDGGWDSALLLEESSFKACPVLEALLNGVAAPDTIVICAGGSVTLTAPDGPNLSWNTGDTTQTIIVTQPGTYSFVMNNTLGSCFSFSDYVTVVHSGAIQTPVITQNFTILEAPNLIPAPGITYQWNLNGVAIPGATQSTFLIPGNGCYTLTIYEGTCESTSNIYCVTNTSINDIQQKLIHIIPHPITGISAIENPFSSGSITTMKLFDLTGQLVLQNQQSGVQLSISKGSLSNGIYFLEITNNEYPDHIMKKVMIQ